MVLKKEKITYSSIYKLVALAAWMGVIFYFSSLPGKSPSAFNFQVFIERKGAHVAEYFILTAFFLRAFQDRKWKAEKLLLGGAVFSLAYALSDEFHQLFVPGRTGKLTDVLIDLVGITGALAAFWLYGKRKPRGSKEAKSK